jgi:hypothetical protein
LSVENRIFIVLPIFRSLNSRISFRLSMTVLALMLASCGLKGPPRLPVYELPHVPENIKIIQRYHPRQVIINWAYPEELRDSLERFVVMRSDGAGTSREIVVKGTAFTDSHLDENKVYTYSVSAVSIDGVHSDVSEPVEVGPVTGLSGPRGLAFDIGKDTVTISWKYPESNVMYNIYTDATLAPTNRRPVSEPFMDVTPFPSMTVSYTVRVVVKETNILTEGPPSEEIVISPEDYVPSSPSGLGYAITDSKVLLFWDENPEVWTRGYRVYRSPLENGDFLPVGTSETPAFEDTDNISGKLFYRIRALGPVNEGPSSETIAVEMKR